MKNAAMVILAIIPGISIVAGLMLLLVNETWEDMWLLGAAVLSFGGISLLFALSTAAILVILEKRR